LWSIPTPPPWYALRIWSYEVASWDLKTDQFFAAVTNIARVSKTMADEVLFVLLLMARHGPQEIELDLPPVWKHYAREIACEKDLNTRGMHVDYFHGVCRFFAIQAAIVMVRHWVDGNPVHSGPDVHLRTPEGRCFTKLGTLAYIDKDFGQVHSMIGIERVDSVLVGSRLKMREYLGGDNANWW
jgi:hypothetical protein